MTRVQVSVETMIAMHNDQLDIIKRIQKNYEELEAHQAGMLDYWFHQLPDIQSNEVELLEHSPLTNKLRSGVSESSKSAISSPSSILNSECIDLSGESDKYVTPEQSPPKKRKLAKIQAPTVEEELYAPCYFGGPIVSDKKRDLPFQTPSPIPNLRGRPRTAPYGPKRKIGRPKKTIDESLFEINSSDE